VLSAVEFYDEPTSAADKINNKWTDWHLPSKVYALRAVSTQRSPYQPFGIGRISAQLPCATALLR
jgi:hypothetical protein